LLAVVKAMDLLEDCRALLTEAKNGIDLANVLNEDA